MPLLIALLALAAAGCGGSDDTSSSSVPLEGTPWTLSTAGGFEIPEGSLLSLTLVEGNASGFSGCNSFNASYELDGSALTFGPFATTFKACPDPETAVEAAYLGALESVAGWDVDGGQLVLTGEDGTELLRYDQAQLEGEWSAVGYLTGDAFTSVLAGTEITATFGADGNLDGSAGCNTYGGTYTTDGSALELSPLAATTKACPEPEGVMEQEQAYLVALESATSFSLGAGGLDLLNAQGQRVASYQRL